MLTVACVKWGDRYSDVWVHRLRAMVAKHLTIPHRFVCLTDRPIDGVECRPLQPKLPTWWAKLSLFPAGTFDDEVLYLDLDVVLTACIDGVVEHARLDRSKLWMRDDFSYSMRKPKQGLDAQFKSYLGGDGCCNSSVMAWHADAARDVWDKFTAAVMQQVHGDQNHISRVMRDRIGFLPDELVGSYKYGQLRGERVAPVMVFHGHPKMDELPRSDGLRKLWEAA